MRFDAILVILFLLEVEAEAEIAADVCSGRPVDRRRCRLIAVCPVQNGVGLGNG